jgi:hypothetical protein
MALAKDHVDPPVVFGTFRELELLPEEPPSLWSGLVPVGALTMLWGDPKKGKSTLLAAALGAIEAGNPFLGRPTSKATGVWLSEEPASALRQKAARFGLFGLESSVAGSDRVFGVRWERLIEQATEHALESGHQLLVVDTFTGLAGLESEQENDAGAIANKLRPLRVASAEGLAVVFVHHGRKRGRSDPRGSSAFRGLVDVSIEFRRHGTSPNFTLRSEGRFEPVAVSGTLDMKGDWSYRATADRGLREASGGLTPVEKDTHLWDALPVVPAIGLDFGQLEAESGLTIDEVMNRLRKWDKPPRESGLVRSGGGKKGDPYLWSRV